MLFMTGLHQTLPESFNWGHVQCSLWENFTLSKDLL